MWAKYIYGPHIVRERTKEGNLYINDSEVTFQLILLQVETYKGLELPRPQNTLLIFKDMFMVTISVSVIL